MAHPKRKTSKTRRDKRRTHQKLAMPTLAPRHEAVWQEDGLYYKGELIVAKKDKKATKAS